MLQQEEEMVRRARQGDKDAVAQLFEANFDKIYKYIAFKVGNRADAEDLTQQTFLLALKSISSYRWHDVPFAAWLFRIAHNQMVDHFRKESKSKRVAMDEANMPSTLDPAALAEQEMTMSELMEACKQLTEAQQEVIHLRFISELSIAETAQVMNKSEGAVKVLQHDAVAKLRSIVSKEESTEKRCRTLPAGGPGGAPQL